MATTPTEEIAKMYTLLTGNAWKKEYEVLIPTAANQTAQDGILPEYEVFAICYLIAHYLSTATGGGTGRVVASETLGNASVSYAVMMVGTTMLDVWMQRYNELARNSVSLPNVTGGLGLNPIYMNDSSRHPRPLSSDLQHRWKDPDI